MVDDGRKTALVMTGGGARAAYQVGVLKAIAELLPKDCANPFPIICGTSAGAINAAALATHAYSFNLAVHRLESFWGQFHCDQVFRTDLGAIVATGFNWMLALATMGRIKKSGSLYLLDRTPLQQLLERQVNTEDIQRCIENGYLYALCITASGYASNKSVSFFQGQSSLQAWQRSRRVGVPAPIGVDHLMASSAIPVVFAPQKIHQEYYGDGSMRQLAPISPALHLGADSVLVIGNRCVNPRQALDTQTRQEPSIGQVAGHVLDSIFLDGLDMDIERLQRINHTISLIDEDQRKQHGVALKNVDVLVVTPSQDMQAIADQHAQDLPRTIGFLLKGIGISNKTHSNLVSYLLFEKSYTRTLIELGYRDALDKKAEIAAFIKI